jgi:hypothetical protein
LVSACHQAKAIEAVLSTDGRETSVDRLIDGLFSIAFGEHVEQLDR